ncbi:MAG: MFS transporter [Blastochloris sp.]|nr:MFS transporter [Blastochloris sp.]
MSQARQLETKTDHMPQGMGNAYWFQMYNSMSYSIVLGLPMMLYFKSLGASGTILGVLTSLSPLLTILQIPAARFVEKVGYRTFVLRGWSIRSVFIIGMLIVPVLPASIDNNSKIVLMLLLLICYNASRGFSSCGFLPWMTQLVPESVRGRFISNDQMCSLISIVITSLAAALIMKFFNNSMGFSITFIISLAGAFVSLYFLKRIPDVPVLEESKSSEAIPWKSLINYGPFKKFLLFNFILIAGLSAGGVISVPMIRDHFGVSDSTFMLLNAGWGVFFIIGAFLSRKSLDRVGSKPVLFLALLLQVLHVVGWAALASGILPFNWWTVGFQQATWGLGFALFQVANMRMVMALVPALGRSHFFALFSVSNSLTAGLFPIFWGILFDALLRFHFSWGRWDWNVYSLLYSVIGLFIILSFYALQRIPEPKAMNTNEFFHELFVQTPAKALSRILGRKILP